MKTYGDIYDEYLDELYQHALDNIPSLAHLSVSKLIKEHAPVDYRCGFNDWIDGYEYEPTCAECGENEVSLDIVRDSAYDSEIRCGVCLNLEFKCGHCEEIFNIKEQSEYDTYLCRSCGESEYADNEDEEDEDA